MTSSSIFFTRQHLSDDALQTSVNVCVKFTVFESLCLVSDLLLVWPCFTLILNQRMRNQNLFKTLLFIFKQTSVYRICVSAFFELG